MKHGPGVFIDESGDKEFSIFSENKKISEGKKVPKNKRMDNNLSFTSQFSQVNDVKNQQKEVESKNTDEKILLLKKASSLESSESKISEKKTIKEEKNEIIFPSKKEIEVIKNQNFGEPELPLDLQKNMYYGIVDISTIMNPKEPSYLTIFNSFCKMFLRNHPKFRKMYDIYCNLTTIKQGYGHFMTFSTFIIFLIDARILDGSLSIATFTQKFYAYIQEDFKLTYQNNQLEWVDKLLAQLDTDEVLKYEYKPPLIISKDDFKQIRGDQYESSSDIFSSEIELQKNEENKKMKNKKKSLGKIELLVQEMKSKLDKDRDNNEKQSDYDKLDKDSVMLYRGFVNSFICKKKIFFGF